MLALLSYVVALFALLGSCGVVQSPLEYENVPSTASFPCDDWDSFNRSVGGRLFAGLPVGLPCYDNFNGIPKSVDKNACDVVEGNRNNMDYLTTQMGGYSQVLQSPLTGYSSSQCGCAG